VPAAALAAAVAAAAPCAQAFDMMGDPTPHGALRVPAHGSASLVLDINARDFVQWTWSEPGGQERLMRTRLVWRDTAGREHAAPPLPPGQAFGNFDAPGDYAVARIEWHNDSDSLLHVQWTYSSSASFWRRPEYVLPSLLPLFLLGAAYGLGRRIDRRRSEMAAGDAVHAVPAASSTQEASS
jgi:hypothetical protein